MNVEVDQDEKDFIAQQVKNLGCIPDVPDALVQLTCAAISGLFRTAIADVPEGFGIKAARCAKAAYDELRKQTVTKE